MVLTLEYEKIENQKSNDDLTKCKQKIEITQDDFKIDDKDRKTKNIMRTPLVFGRGTKAFQPDVCIPVEYISNKHFQVAAYSRGLPTDGFYITDLLSKTKTSLEFEQFCYIDDGNVLEFNSFEMNFLVTMCPLQVRPRYLEDDPELENYVHVNSRVERKHVTNEKPFIELCELDNKENKKKKFDNDFYLYFKKDEKGVVTTDWVELPKVANSDKNGKLQKVAKFFFKTNKWICEIFESAAANILLVNREEWEGNKLSAGLKLKKGLVISCAGVKITVDSCNSAYEENKNK